MKKCVICGKELIHEYYWNGQVYGRECWKKYVLPEYREQRKQEKFAEWNIKCRLLVEVLKVKDLSRIKNQWKKDFIKSLIQQFEEKNRMSRKQYNIAEEMLNSNDMVVLYNMKFELGLIDEETYWEKIRYYAPRRSKLFKEAEEWFEAKRRVNYVEHWRKNADEVESLKPYRNLIHNMLDAIEAGELDKKEFDYHQFFCAIRDYAIYFEGGVVPTSLENVPEIYQPIVMELQEAIERWGN